MKQEDNYYKTKSLILGAYILATEKVQLITVDKSNPKEAFFVFDTPTLCEQLVSDYWADKASVNPKILNSKLSDLKDQIFN